MNKKVDEKELNDTFEQDAKMDTFQGTVKKAQRKVFKRQIVISTLASLGVIIILSIGWISLMGLSQANTIHDYRMYSTIRNPNVLEVGYKLNGDGIFEGSVTFTQYKMLDNKPVDWSDETIRYNLLGRSSGILGDHSPIQITDETGNTPRYFNREVKERLLQFYHPDGSYDGLRNDLEHLSKMNPNQIIEMAISFNESYSPSEVRNFLPKQVSLKWYWVDTFKEEDARLSSVKFNTEEVGTSPLFPDEVYGFDEDQGTDQPSEAYFLRDLKSGVEHLKNNKYSEEFKRIYDLLRNGKQELLAEEVPIIGVVVTGTPQDLEALKETKQIRAAVFGAFTETDY
ncbi:MULTISPECIES: anti sigma factor C-terminal domain-containing protein [Bacillota]|uniref:anti sigma factor C-terminal domain-containing protein n=1 Tax=Bacillota TaxID=1239 RepID=UPI0039F000CD